MRCEVIAKQELTWGMRWCCQALYDNWAHRAQTSARERPALCSLSEHCSRHSHRNRRSRPTHYTAKGTADMSRAHPWE